MIVGMGAPEGAVIELVNGFGMLGGANTLRRNFTLCSFLWLFSVLAMVLLVKDSHHFRLFLGGSLALLLLGLAHSVYVQRRFDRGST